MNALEGRNGNLVTIKGQQYLYFAGNDYLGLSTHPDTIKAATQALQRYGVSFSAARQTTGTSDIHLELEKQLSQFKGEEASLVFASGYLGTRLLLEEMKNDYVAIFADSMAHPSILEGIPRGFNNLKFYNHCDPDHLEELLSKTQCDKPMIITDGIFALTGEIAPIGRISELAVRFGARLIIDDAHATGILGRNGRGTPDYFNLNGASHIYQAETLSKAIGAYGGFLSGRKDFIQSLREHSSLYGASTALPPPVVAAACASLRIMKENPSLRDGVLDNAKWIREEIRNLGFSTSGDDTPIIPIYFREEKSARHLSAWLENQFIIAPVVNYPVSIGRFLVRMTVSASHTQQQMKMLLCALQEWSNKHTI